MAKLTAAQRKDIPKKEFGVPSKAPGSGSFPLNDKNHARNALARVSEMENKGSMPKSVADGVRAKADKMLGKATKKGK